MLLKIIRTIFLSYTLILFVRIVGSWFPSFARTKFMRFTAFYADPYLGLFRKIIPPIGGVLDLSPILGYIGLQFLEKILTSIVR